MVARYLIEFDSHDGDSKKKVRLSTGAGFQTNLAETPSREVYLPLVKDAGNINSFLFGEASTSGFSPFGIGKVILNNIGGDLDYLEDRGLGGFDIDIREERGVNYPSDFPVRMSGAVSYAQFSSFNTELIVKDRTSLFRDLQYQPLKFSGNNDWVTIELEGTSDDIGGLPKPLLLGGVSRNFTPPVVNEQKEIVQISSEPVAELVAVMVGREPIDVDTVFTDLTTFLSSNPNPGKYNVYFGDYLAVQGSNERGCYVMVSTTPSHPLTFDAIEGWKNRALFSEDFTDAVWIKSDLTVLTDGVVSPNNDTNANTLVADSVDATCLQTVIAPSNQYTFGIFLKRKTGVGNVSITLDGGIIWETQAVSDEWVFFETSPQVITDPQVGLKLTTSGDEVYSWGAMCCQRDLCGPYVKTESLEVYNNHIPALIWKIMNLKGYELDSLSVAIAQAKFPHHAQHWQETYEVLTSHVVDLVKDSGLFYLTNDVKGKFVIDQLTLPSPDESLASFDSSQILGGFGKPKLKRVTSRDSHKGIPSYSTTIGYEQNYTLMGKENLTGIAETTEQLAFVGNEFRSSNVSDYNIKEQFPNSPEIIKNGKLSDISGAGAFSTYLHNVFKNKRPTIEVKLPIEFATKTNGDIIEKGEVIEVDRKLYRIIGQKVRFPSENRRDAATSAVTYQGWGGVDNYVANAVHLDGVDDYLLSDPLTDGAVSSEGTVSLWVKYNEPTSSDIFPFTEPTIGYLADGRFEMGRNRPEGYLQLFLRAFGSPFTETRMRTTTDYSGVTNWLHFAASWRILSPPDRFFHLHINDVSDLYLEDYNFQYRINNNSQFVVGARSYSPPDRIDQCLADIYISDQYMDLSKQANRRRFISDDGKPVFLGDNGEKPTGSKPLVFLSGDSETWHINKGKGEGGFTVFGGKEHLVTAPTSPSD